MIEKMTVHKALCELKILNDRIESGMTAEIFVVSSKHSNTKIGGVPVEQFCREVQEKYQSLQTLISRRNAIKRAVIRSNAETKVTIAGKEYTVAEAIDMKSTGMQYLEKLGRIIAGQLNSAKRQADMENGSKLDDRTDNYIKSMYGTSDMKNMSDEVKKVRDAFITAQTVEIVDPLNAAEVVEGINKTIDTFMADVDSALSVSNALTTVEVEYETY